VGMYPCHLRHPGHSGSSSHPGRHDAAGSSGGHTTGPVAVGVNAVPSPAASVGTSGATATSGAPIGAQNRAVGRNPGTSRSLGVTRSNRASTGASSASSFTARASGATVGTASRGGQHVFGSSRAKGKASGGTQRAIAPATSRSATGDLWSGFKPGARSSVLAAQASPDKSGLGGTAIAALAMLGLGLAGFVAATSFVALRSRRAKAAGRSGTTK
jgi:hypothetical protein